MTDHEERNCILRQAETTSYKVTAYKVMVEGLMTRDKYVRSENAQNNDILISTSYVLCVWGHLLIIDIILIKMNMLYCECIVMVLNFRSLQRDLHKRMNSISIYSKDFLVLQEK